jgi:cytoskeletal protein RodZ
MGHFGQELRRERESRGIALDAITSETKISTRHLLSLEEGKFDALPGGVLSKGIVRGYARVVGLDEEECVRRYIADFQRSGLHQDDDSAWTEFAANVGRNRKGDFGHPTRLQWAGVMLLLTLLAVFGWYVAHYVQGRISETIAAPTNTGRVVAPVTAPALAATVAAD